MSIGTGSAHAALTDRVPRTGSVRTASGPEGSSAKDSLSGAAAPPDPSRRRRYLRRRSRLDDGARGRASSEPRPGGSSANRENDPVTALYRKYRPQGFDEVVGQEAVVRTLAERDRARAGAPGLPLRRPARDREDVHGADPREGAELPRDARRRRRTRTRPARSCVAIANGSSLDVVEMDAASQRGIDDIREIRERVVLQPVEGRYKVYIIDEAHQLTDAGLERAAEADRGASSPPSLRVLHDGPRERDRDRAVALPDVRLPAPAPARARRRCCVGSARARRSRRRTRRSSLIARGARRLLPRRGLDARPARGGDGRRHRRAGRAPARRGPSRRSRCCGSATWSSTTTPPVRSSSSRSSRSRARTSAGSSPT